MVKLQVDTVVSGDVLTRPQRSLTVFVITASVPRRIIQRARGYDRVRLLRMWESRPLNSFHPEMALFRNLGVNQRNCLSDVPYVRLGVIP